MKRLLVLIGLVALVFLVVLNLKPGGGSAQIYRIARDPTWYPLDLKARGKNILAFSDDLLRKIAEEEVFRIELMSAPWDTHVPLLDRGTADGVLTPFTPTNQLRDRFYFSEPYLFLGPVLLVRKESTVTSLADLQEGELGIQIGQGMNFPMPANGRITVRQFDDMSDALQLLLTGELDGVIINYLDAEAIVQGYYSGQLKIATAPLSELGLRLMARKPGGQDLIESFNRGLEDLKEDGSLRGLILKWGILR